MKDMDIILIWKTHLSPLLINLYEFGYDIRLILDSLSTLFNTDIWMFDSDCI